MRKFMTLHRNVRVRIGLAFVHKLIDARRFGAQTAWPRRSTTARSVRRNACLFSGFDSAV